MGFIQLFYFILIEHKMRFKSKTVILFPKRLWKVYRIHYALLNIYSILSLDWSIYSWLYVITNHSEANKVLWQLTISFNIRNIAFNIDIIVSWYTYSLTTSIARHNQNSFEITVLFWFWYNKNKRLKIYLYIFLAHLITILLSSFPCQNRDLVDNTTN